MFIFPTKILDNAILPPVISTPAAGATGQYVMVDTSINNISDQIYLNAAGVDWQLSKSSTFTTTIDSVTNKTTDKLNWTTKVLQTNTVYYLRARFNHPLYGLTPWSTTVSFTTRNKYYDFKEFFCPADAKADDYVGYLNSGRTIRLTKNNDRLVTSTNWARNEAGTTDIGVAWVYRKENGLWVQEQKFRHTLALNVGYAYGISCDISDNGDVMVVGSQGEPNGSWSSSGAIYIYRRSGTTWTLEQKIQAPLPIVTSGYIFGSSVTLSGDGTRIFVGEYQSYRFGSSSGAVHIYRYVGGATPWVSEAVFSHTSAAANDRFGRCVASNNDGSVIAVRANNGSSMTNSVFVFRRSGTTWTQELAIPGTISAQDYTVDISDNGMRVAVTFNGRIQIYEKDTGTWTKVYDVAISSVDTIIGNVGSRVTIDAAGELVVVGQNTNALNSNVPGVFLFQRVNGVWGYVEKILTQGILINGDAGSQNVYISDDARIVIAGAYLRDVTASNSGALLIYEAKP